MNCDESVKPIARVFLFLGFVAAAAGWLELGCAGRTSLSVGAGGTSGIRDAGSWAGSGGSSAAGGNGSSGDLGGRIAAGGSSGGSSGETGGAAAVDARVCDGTVLNGIWRRPFDGLTMTLVADGCVITGTADTPYYRHTVTGVYDDAARTMQGSVERTNTSSGCVTIMTMTLVLTDATHFLAAIIGTDGRCDLLTTYNEASVWTRQ